MERLLRPVTISTSSRPAATASSTTYWMAGLSTTGSISLGVALVAGRNLVPRPAAGMTALVHSSAAAGVSAMPEHYRTLWCVLGVSGWTWLFFAEISGWVLGGYGGL